MDKEQIVKENFGKRAEKYNKSLTNDNLVALDRMTKMLGDSAETALDVATGGGHTAIKLAELTQQVTAIDITPEMIEVAQANATKEGVANIEFATMDVHQMSFVDQSFDIVASRFAPHHFADIKKALAEMMRVLKTNGKLYILDCSVINGEISEAVINHIELLRDPSHRCSYSPRYWEQFLKDLPLEVEHMELLTEQYELPNWFERTETPEEKRQEIFSYLDSLTPTLKRYYVYGEQFITTYRIEILARRK